MHEAQTTTAPRQDGQGRTTPAKICAAMLWTSAANLAGLLALALWLLSITNSYLFASALFACQWVLPLLLPKGIDWLRQDRSPRAVAIPAQLLTVAIYVLLALCVATRFVPGVFLLVALHGYTDALTRAAASHAMRLSGADPEPVDDAMGTLGRWRLVGGSAAGVLFAFVGATTQAQDLLMAAAVVHVISAVIYASVALPARIPPAGWARPATKARIRDILRNEPVAKVLLAQLAIITLFQGMHYAILVAYPGRVLHQGGLGIGTISAVSTSAMLCGSLLFTSRSVRKRLGSTRPWVFAVAAGLLATAAVSLTSPIPGYVVYFVFFLILEAGFQRFNQEFIAAIQPANGPSMLSLRARVLCGSILAGIGMTTLGLAFTTVGLSVYAVSYVAAFLAAIVYRRYLLTKNA
ncbi:hypothetical protein [Amycolatopsis sp. NPDC059657]|uniref:hypothetical protein n=1 Tax=Amycolatopsis sp. NPDC059657 TaxID=3346899 RepID=UPI00366A5FF4